MKKILLILILCGCSQSIRDYELKSPEYVEEAVAMNVALLKKNKQLIDAYFIAIQKEVCTLDKGFLEWLASDYKERFDIIFGDDFCRVKND